MDLGKPRDLQICLCMSLLCLYHRFVTNFSFHPKSQLKSNIIKRLIPMSINTIISPHFLNFQSRLCVILQQKRLRSVRPGQYKEHEKMLKEIWEAAKLGGLAKTEEIEGEAGEGGREGLKGGQLGRSTRSGPGAETRMVMGMGKFGLGLGEIDRGAEGWKMIGLGEEDQDGVLGEAAMFRDVGELGLECLVRNEVASSVLVQSMTDVLWV